MTPTIAMSDDEFVAGYLDGRDPNSPEPSDNRSHSYRHSFMVGRAEIEGKPIAAGTSRRSAADAEMKDASQ
jgi:hypothetical protein